MSDHTIHTQKVDTHSYKGWLNSDSFWKRAFAILGYSTVAGLIVSIPFYIIGFIMAMVFFAAMSGSMSHMKDVRANAEAATQKINLAFICDEISYDKDFKTEVEVSKFIADCEAGKYSADVSAYIQSMNVDGKAI